MSLGGDGRDLMLKRGLRKRRGERHGEREYGQSGADPHKTIVAEDGGKKTAGRTRAGEAAPLAQIWVLKELVACPRDFKIA